MKFSFTKVASSLFVLGFLCSFPTTGFGQNKFLDGHIVSVKGDTIYGQIKYDAWDKSPVSIDFLDKEGITKSIPAQEIRAFSIPKVDERYRSATIAMLHIDLN